MTDSATRLPDTDATGMAAMVREGEVSARELVETAIARIEQMNPELNAVGATRFEEALAEVDAGLPQGPLPGEPVLLKGLNMAVKGLPSKHGRRLLAETQPTYDDTQVETGT